MRIAVIGAGIVGVTTAYELAADGHEVTVFERRGSVAEETSFANAGVVAPGYVTPWAAPGMPAKVLKHLYSAATRRCAWRWPMAPGQLGLAVALVARLPRTGVHRQPGAMYRLARYSQQRLHALTQALSLRESNSASGYLVLLRSDAGPGRRPGGLKLLAELGVDFHLVARKLVARSSRRWRPAPP
jgi:D-amino-acid dehydrogenase